MQRLAVAAIGGMNVATSVQGLAGIFVYLVVDSLGGRSSRPDVAREEEGR